MRVLVGRIPKRETSIRECRECSKRMRVHIHKEEMFKPTKNYPYYLVREDCKKMFQMPIAHQLAKQAKEKNLKMVEVDEHEGDLLWGDLPNEFMGVLFCKERSFVNYLKHGLGKWKITEEEARRLVHEKVLSKMEVELVPPDE